MLYRLICNSNHALSQKFDKNEGLKAQFEEIKREHDEKSEERRGIFTNLVYRYFSTRGTRKWI